jgi:Glycosyl transferase 4-like domain
MRILNVTQSYSPFFEFGGPPAKVRALSEGLARRGHGVTVLTADWGLEKRLQPEKGEVGAEHSPFGMRREENGVQAIYLPTWMKYRAKSWNPAVKRYCRARLQNFDVVHIFGLYDLLGSAVAAACRARVLPYVIEPMGMFVPIARNLPMKWIYHFLFGRLLFEGARAVIATSEQEAEELATGGIPREKIVVRRNGVARLVSDLELHARLAADCSVAASQLGWVEPVKQMEELYGKLAASRPAVAQSLSVG